MPIQLDKNDIKQIFSMVLAALGGGAVAGGGVSLFQPDPLIAHEAHNKIRVEIEHKMARLEDKVDLLSHEVGEIKGMLKAMYGCQQGMNP